jgi:hypothetical protein
MFEARTLGTGERERLVNRRAMDFNAASFAAGEVRF